MNYSKAHQNFSDYLRKPEAFTNPQDFLGPNYQTVLNFWWYLDGLSKKQLKVVSEHYRSLDSVAYDSAYHAAYDAARDVAWDAAWDAAINSAIYAAGYATLELMGMHILLDQGKTLMFVPLFNDL